MVLRAWSLDWIAFCERARFGECSIDTPYLLTLLFWSVTRWAVSG
jgi:hypothetical protein